MRITDVLRGKGGDVATIGPDQSVPALLDALHGLRSRRRPNPTIVIADTTKGAGIDSMSCIPLWHGAAPAGDAATLAVAELERNSPHA